MRFAFQFWKSSFRHEFIVAKNEENWNWGIAQNGSEIIEESLRPILLVHCLKRLGAGGKSQVNGGCPADQSGNYSQSAFRGSNIHGTVGGFLLIYLIDLISNYIGCGSKLLFEGDSCFFSGMGHAFESSLVRIKHFNQRIFSLTKSEVMISEFFFKIRLGLLAPKKEIETSRQKQDANDQFEDEDRF